MRMRQHPMRMRQLFDCYYFPVSRLLVAVITTAQIFITDKHDSL